MDEQNTTGDMNMGDDAVTPAPTTEGEGEAATPEAPAEGGEATPTEGETGGDM